MQDEYETKAAGHRAGLGLERELGSKERVHTAFTCTQGEYILVGGN